MAKKVLRSAEKFSEPFPPLSVTPLPLCEFGIENAAICDLRLGALRPRAMPKTRTMSETITSHDVLI